MTRYLIYRRAGYSDLDEMISILYWVFIIGLIVLFIVSFTLFVRRMLINATVKSKQSVRIEKKLDRIIELLEQEKNT